MAAGPGNIDSLVASTIKKFKKGFVDQIIRDNIIFAFMLGKDLSPSVYGTEDREGKSEFGEGLKFEDGGEKIFFPLMYAKNATVAGYSGYDALDITHAERFTAAEYEWKSVAGSINLDYETIDKNQGNSVKLFDYVEGQLNNLKASLQDKFAEYLLSAKASGDKLPNGLLDLVQDDPTADPSIGSIGGVTTAAGANTWWKNQVVDHNSANFGTDQTGDGLKNIRKLLRDCRFGKQGAQVLLAGEIAYERTENALVNQLRYVPVSGKAAKQIADAGFEVLMVHGVPMVLEKLIDTVRTSASLTGSAIYALNFNFLKIHAMKHRFFEFSKIKEPTDQDTMVQHCITRLQFCTNGRRYQGVMKEITDN
jgi:hypothetical protein